ncbi:MAG: pilin [Patescibacteria group bacterium]|jgi:hypothetical protein|nr:pilin [Patescibacteria group bacterium]
MKQAVLSLYILLFWLTFIAPSAVLVAEGKAVDDLDAICSQSKNKNSSLCIGWRQGSENTENSDNVVLDIIKRIIDLLAYIAGILAVLYIMWGGFRYIKSAGSSEKAADGRKMIIYALIGVIVIVLSRYIVLFFINQFK